MQINAAALAALFKGYRTQFLEAMHGASPQWPKIAMETPSTKGEELYAWLGSVPGMKKLVGEITIENLAASNYTIRNDEFESTVAVKQADVERDSFAIYNKLFQALGLAASQHPDELVANLLINGFTAKDYTGVAFFGANKPHETDGKVKFSNLGTKKLSAANFETARANIKGRTNSKGRPMNLGMSLLLIVSPTYESTARKILIADTAAAGETNVNKGTADLLVWPQLAADEHKWFLLDVGHPVKPLILQMEKKAELASLTSMESDHVFKNHEFLYQAYGRYNAGYGLPQLAYGSTGADAA